MTATAFLAAIRAQSAAFAAADRHGCDAALVFGAAIGILEQHRARLISPARTSAPEAPLAAFRSIRNVPTSFAIVGDVVGEQLGIDPRAVYERREVLARQLAIFFLRRYTRYSSTLLAAHFGLRDHTTVLYACQVIPEKLARGKISAVLVASIERAVRVRLPAALDRHALASVLAKVA